MNRAVLLILVVILLVSMSSCVKEDLSECPPQFTVKVFVEDKEYINISDIPELNQVDKDQPFSTFVSTIYYSLVNTMTGDITNVSSIIPVTGDAIFYTILFNNIPDGKYELTVWGNVTPNIPFGSLHTNGMELTDVYVASSPIQFTSGSQTIDVNLKRAKGKLALICENFPSSVTQVEQKISSLYESVDSLFNYSGKIIVDKKGSFQPIIQTFLAPTVIGENPKLNLSFKDGSTLVSVPEISLSVYRNKISPVKVTYNDIAGLWEISVNIDGKWSLVHALDITNILSK